MIKNETLEQNKGILNFVLIGAKASGKTMYLGTLFGEKVIQSIDGETTSYVSPIWKTINEKDPETGVRKCQVGATAGKFEELHFSYQHRNFGRLSFSIDDYDGSFTETVSKWETSLNNGKTSEESTYNNTTEERQKLLLNVKNSEGCIFFLPYEESNERFKDFAEEIDAFIKWAQFSSSSKSPIPASVVITKWDDSPHFNTENEKDVLEEYISSNEHFRRIYETIKKNFKHTQLIAISSCKNYNLSKPIDFSLENTFYDWYETTKKYKETKKYEKLVRYITERYNDIKFNEKYDFLILYDEAQKDFLKIVKETFEKKETLTEKETYLKEIELLFLTQKELLAPLQDTLGKLKRSATLQKTRNVTITVVVIITVAIGILEYKNKLDAEESYKVILSKYQKGVPYQEMKKEIDQFLKAYKKVNFLYALAKVPEKRIEVQKIKNELYGSTHKSIDEKINSILQNSNYTNSEKEMHLTALKNQAAGTMQLEMIEQKIKQLGTEANLEKWEEKAENCLSTCIDPNDIEKVKMLLSEYNTNMSIVHSKQSDLLSKKLNKKIEVLKFQSVIENVNSIDDMITVLSNDQISDETFENDDLRTLLINKIINLENNKFMSPKGQQLLAKLKSKHSREDMKEFMEGDIKKFFDSKENFDNIMRQIQDAGDAESLKVIEYSNYSRFEPLDKEKIQKELKDKLNQFVDAIMETEPISSTDVNVIQAWVNAMKPYEDLTILLGNDDKYIYHLSSDNLNSIEKIKKQIKTISDIKDNGVDNIRVSIEGKEGNTLDFACGIASEHELVIDGLGQKLSYENIIACYDNNIMTFSDTVTLKDTTYYITITDKDIFKDDKVAVEKAISMEDLINLSNGNRIPEIPLDDNKMILRFHKAD